MECVREGGEAGTVGRAGEDSGAVLLNSYGRQQQVQGVSAQGNVRVQHTPYLQDLVSLYGNGRSIISVVLGIQDDNT